MKLKIRVANPVSVQMTYISVKSAERYVARGRARWQGERTIRFIEDSHDRRSAEKSAALARQLGYDRVGRLMTLDEVRGLPVVGDPAKLFRL